MGVMTSTRQAMGGSSRILTSSPSAVRPATSHATPEGPRDLIKRRRPNAMIARTWRGWTRSEDSDAYVDYVKETGIAEYRATPGNRAAFVLRRDEGDRAEFVTLTFWDSMDAVRGFAGDDVERAVFYPDDD